MIRGTQPRVFISYSWDSAAHKAWVKQLAKRLADDGAVVILDQWEVALGDQLPQFMEQSVETADYVLMICTPGYKRRVDSRSGGGGYEGHIITAKAFGGHDPRKYVPVLREGEWASAAATWLLGKAYADLRGEPYSEEEYLRLVEHLNGDIEAAPEPGAYRPRRHEPDF